MPLWTELALLALLAACGVGCASPDPARVADLSDALWWLRATAVLENPVTTWDDAGVNYTWTWSGEVGIPAAEARKDGVDGAFSFVGNADGAGCKVFCTAWTAWDMALTVDDLLIGTARWTVEGDWWTIETGYPGVQDARQHFDGTASIDGGPPLDLVFESFVAENTCPPDSFVVGRIGGTDFFIIRSPDGCTFTPPPA